MNTVLAVNRPQTRITIQYHLGLDVEGPRTVDNLHRQLNLGINRPHTTVGSNPHGIDGRSRTPLLGNKRGVKEFRRIPVYDTQGTHLFMLL